MYTEKQNIMSCRQDKLEMIQIKVAIVGSRGITFYQFERYLPESTSEILSGGAKGIDTCAREFAKEHQIPFTEFLPDYHRFGRAAPIKRNDRLIDAADMVLIFWDGTSKGTQYVIRRCEKLNKSHQVIVSQPIGNDNSRL